jgi:hypothetical protein
MIKQWWHRATTALARLPHRTNGRGQLGPRPALEVLENRALPSFLAPVNLATGQNPVDVAVADLRGDGIQDIVTANASYSTGSVSVLLGNGDGTFQQAVDYSSGFTNGNGRFLAVADFNGDGIADLVVAGNNSVSVLLGNGDGSFQAPKLSSAGLSISGLTVGDFNGDGLADVAVSDDGQFPFNNNYGVRVLLGNGDGTFRPSVLYATAQFPGMVAVADFNADGIPDIAAQISSEVDVFFGNGDGSFQPASPIATGSSANSMVVADVNGDSIPDLITGDYSATVTVLVGKGDGSFQPPAHYPVGDGVTFVTAADLGNNGILDLVTTNHIVAGQMTVLHGNGDGTFQGHVAFPVGSIGNVAVGDFGGDGATELVAVSETGGVNLIFSSGDGSLIAPTVYGVGVGPVSVAVADLNHDGIPDVVTADEDPTLGNRVSVLLGNGDGTFRPTVNYLVGKSPQSVVVADVNGDGIPDLITANQGTYPNNTDGSVSVLLGNGDGTFQPAVNYAAGIKPYAVAVGDLGNDGQLDLVVANDTSAGTVSVLRGNGDGTFQDPVSYASGSHPDAVAVSDLTGDGILDIVVANSASNTLSILLGNGDGTFKAKNDYVASGQPESVAVADLNGDGIPDLVTANGSNSVSVLIGNGDGSFQTPANHFVAGANSVAVVDVNQDGVPDLVTADLGGAVSVLVGNGDGSFQAPVTYGTGARPTGIAAADLTGDGFPDLVTANSYDPTVTVIRNDANWPAPPHG